MLIGATNLSPIIEFVAGTGAVSRYKLPTKTGINHGREFLLRADARVRVQRHNEFVLSAGAKAKSVTNNLPILSVLCAALFYSNFLSIATFSSLLSRLNFDINI